MCTVTKIFLGILILENCASVKIVSRSSPKQNQRYNFVFFSNIFSDSVETSGLELRRRGTVLAKCPCRLGLCI
jgi:hypothetical protein